MGQRVITDNDLSNILKEMHINGPLAQYPVGSYYCTGNSTINPATYFGGEWERVQGNYMELTLGSNTATSIPAAWTYIKVPFPTQGLTVGEGLTFISKQGIRVDKPGYYRISGMGGANSPSYFVLRLDNSTLATAILPSGSYSCCGLGSPIRYISAGQLVSLQMTKSGSVNPTLFASCKLFVEQVDIPCWGSTTGAMWRRTA